MIKILKRTAIFLFSLSLFYLTMAAESLSVVINEIAWMGTESSYSNEWIELYNNTDLPINLDGWALRAVDGTPEINLTGIIPSKDFYLLERTDDNTVPALLADHIYAGALSNKGEYLKLFDGENNLIDEVNCTEGWFAGDNSTKQTMERKNPQSDGNNSLSWQTSQNPDGTPKSQNSSGLPEDGSPIATKEDIREEAETITYPAGIVFSEILPSPEGPDAENEWVEIANKNNFGVDLTGWKILDTIGSTHTYIFYKNTIVKPKGFLVLGRPETKITLNNSGDSLKLVRPDNAMADTVVYEKAPLGQSYSLKDGHWLWGAILTPGTINVISILKSPEESFSPPAIAQGESQVKTAQELEIDSEEITKELASIKEQIPEQSFNFFTIALIALFLAISSGIIILFLKSKLGKIDFLEKLS